MVMSQWSMAKEGAGITHLNQSFEYDRLVGLVVKASASRAEGPGFESRWLRDFWVVSSIIITALKLQS